MNSVGIFQIHNASIFFSCLYFSFLDLIFQKKYQFDPQSVCLSVCLSLSLWDTHATVDLSASLQVEVTGLWPELNILGFLVKKGSEEIKKGFKNMSLFVVEWFCLFK